MEIATLPSLLEIPATEWDCLLGPDHNPFLCHAFLAGLEQHGCVGERWGWLPHHVVVREQGRLLGAVPLYRKYNSYGELVFDWAWADAYQRAGERYYPKLVAAVPYSPVTGPRLLLHPTADRPGVEAALLAAVAEEAQRLAVSSVHWLFPDAADQQHLLAAGHLPRHDCQFHWHNRGYRDFDDFLDTFTAEKRKKIKRERRRVGEQGVELELLSGQQVDEGLWHTWHRFYQDTFDRRGGYPTLTAPFFRQLGEQLQERVLLVVARQQGKPVAAALSLRSADTLYGRHWGCLGEFHSLHFEACYYAGIDYCISAGLSHFEPGAQGEHKVSRGFEPTLTRSAHWLADPRFAEAIDHYLAREREAVADYMREVTQHLPFRQAPQEDGA